MPKHDINILINARDTASAKLKTVATNTGQLEKATNKLSALKLVLDVTGLGQYSQAIGAAEQGVSQLSSAQGDANKSSLAFKASLLGITGVAAFKLGTALSGVAKDTKALNAAMTESIALQQRQIAVMQMRRKLQLDIIGITKSGDGKTQAIGGVVGDIDKDIRAKTGSIRTLKAELKDLKALSGSRYFGRNAAVIKLIESQIAAQTSQVTRLKVSAQQLRDGIKLDAIRKETELIKARKSARMDEAKAVVGYIDSLRKQVTVLKQTEKQNAVDKAKTLGFVSTAEQKEIGKLIEQKNTIIDQNKARLESEKEVARLRDSIKDKRGQLKAEQADDAARRQRNLTGPTQSLQAAVSRFLTRGVVQKDPSITQRGKILIENKKQAKLQDDIKSQLIELNRLLSSQPETQGV